MIKLRVEWHLECQSCGTELVTDFFRTDARECVCPWCGCEPDGPSSHEDTGLKDYVQSAVRNIEEEANARSLF